MAGGNVSSDKQNSDRVEAFAVSFCKRKHVWCLEEVEKRNLTYAGSVYSQSDLETTLIQQGFPFVNQLWLNVTTRNRP